MSKRILAIEDHEENRRILRLLLQSAGFEMIDHVGHVAVPSVSDPRLQ